MGTHHSNNLENQQQLQPPISWSQLTTIFSTMLRPRISQPSSPYRAWKKRVDKARILYSSSFCQSSDFLKPRQARLLERGLSGWRNAQNEIVISSSTKCSAVAAVCPNARYQLSHYFSHFPSSLRIFQFNVDSEIGFWNLLRPSLGLK